MYNLYLLYNDTVLNRTKHIIYLNGGTIQPASIVEYY